MRTHAPSRAKSPPTASAGCPRQPAVWALGDTPPTQSSRDPSGNWGLSPFSPVGTSPRPTENGDSPLFAAESCLVRKPSRRNGDSPRFPHPHRSRGGFTLLEVVCSLVILMLAATFVASALSSSGRLIEIRDEAAAEFDVAVELLDCIELNVPPAGATDSLGDGSGATGVLQRPEGDFRYSVTRTSAEAVDGMDLLVVHVARDHGSGEQRAGVAVSRLLPRVGQEEAANVQP